MSSRILWRSPQIRRAARKLAAYETEDWLTRIQFLEGVAGVNPGTWARAGKNEAAILAQNHFKGIDKNWVASSNQGLYQKALKSLAGEVSKAKHLMLDVNEEDILQNALAGLNRSGGKIDPWFWSMGKAYGRKRGAERLSSGDLKPRGILGTVKKWAQKLALNYVRPAKTRSKRVPTKSIERTRVTEEGQAQELQIGTYNDLDAGEQYNLVLALLSGKSPAAQKVRSFLRRVWDQGATDSYRRIYEAYLDLVQRKRDVNYQDVAREVGISRQYVGKTISKMLEQARKAIKKNPRLTDEIEDSVEFSRAGWGHRMAKRKRLREQAYRSPRLRKHFADG